MEVKEGYKRTDAGVIPEDWDVKLIDDLAEKVMVGIASAATHAYRPQGIPLLRNQNIKKGHLQDDDLLFVDEEYELIYKNKRLRTGDLLTARTGYPGTTCIIPPKYDGAQCFTTIITRLKKNEVNSNYLCHYINSEYGLVFIEKSKIGGGQKNIGVGIFQAMPIPIPSPAEQEAIAEALSDADALIAALEQLIAKKRQIKQGAMQELMSGRKRLLGFSGEWKVTRFGDLGSTFGGLSGKTKADFGHGSARYITFMNIIYNTVIDNKTFDLVNVKPTEDQNKVIKGDLFFNGSSETPEEVGMCSVLLDDVENVYVNSFCFGFRFRENVKVNGLYFAYYFRSHEGRELMKSLAQGAIRYNLSKTALLKLSFPVPDYEEQTAIAEILSDMDAEIAALEGKLSKAREVKQGMMQELLTGRVRLI